MESSNTNTENKLEITPIEEYEIPEGLPVNPDKWNEAIISHKEERQIIIANMISRTITPEEAKSRLSELREQVLKTYLKLLSI